MRRAELQCIVGCQAAPSPLKSHLKIANKLGRDKYEEELLSLWEAENPAGTQPQGIWVWTESNKLLTGRHGMINQERLPTR